MMIIMSNLDQVMACLLPDTVIVYWTFTNKLQWNLKQNKKQIAFEVADYKM